MLKPAELTTIRLYFYCAFVLMMLLNACRSAGDSAPDPANPGIVLPGSVYYSGASQMYRYDLSTRQEHLLFADGSDYAISGAGNEFVWYKSSPFDGTTRIQIHTTTNPGEHQVIDLDLELESTPKIAADSILAALTRSTGNPYTRTDLLVFNREGKRIGWLYNVKDFSFTPDGKDLVAAAEVTQNGRTVYGLILLKDFLGQSSPVLLREFADYDALPTSMAVSPDGSRLAYAHLEHLYIMPMQAGAEHWQLTDSGHHENQPGWSPDGKYLAFNHYSIGAFNSNCGNVMVIPVSEVPADPIYVVTEGSQDASNPLHPFPLLLQTPEDLRAATCGSNGVVWVP
jgi:dipeptidyl aminopeptidase/acylaminoacyl peptidase